MIASYSENSHGETSMNYTTYYRPTAQNKIYYGTQFKRFSIFRHPNKNVNGQMITYIYHKPIDTQQYLNLTIITDEILKKICLKKQHTTLHQRRYPTTLINKESNLADKCSKEN